MNALVLLLADGRFPAGGHAHSGGIEWATRDGSVHDERSLLAFLEGALATNGLVDASLAAAVVAQAHGTEALPWDDLDAEAAARIASPALRRTSRALGGQLARAAASIWDRDPLRTAALRSRSPGVHRSIALGATAAAAGLDEREIAAVAAYSAVTGPASAAVRILGLDPIGVHALVAHLAPAIDAIAGVAARCATGALAALPALGAPIRELAAAEHATWEVRLFAS